MALTQHWKLNDSAANTAAVATVGTNGVYARNSSFTSSLVGPGTAITISQLFNGTSDKVDISASSISFANNTAYSMSLFFAAANTSNNPLMGMASGFNPRIRINSGTAIGVSSDGTLVTFTVPSIGTAWHHLLITRTAGNSTRLFLDGTESSTGAQSMSGIVAPLAIGVVSTSFYAGNIAWVKMFNSDESANVAALVAEKDAAGNLARAFNYTNTAIVASNH